ncbi:hypothetical protein PUMCH_000128 [Australozyma saopauloensis]|uniref:Dipeptidyl aminopeptidase A n=1 Tax=Australozyma saopauloensis TaxID=291208 RepID=A0AAX4H2Y1_9ASCO|nr:hypothetical protein PUMCH_000128 [[Candida] saopauloensis]
MSYHPVDIALQDLSKPDDSAGIDNDYLLDAGSDASETSVVFDSIDKAVSSCLESDVSANESLPDMAYFNPHELNKLGFLKKLCSFFGLGVLSIWLLAVMVYSNTNISTATKLWKDKNSFKVTGLENRNISLNAYSPSQQNVTLDSYRKGSYRSSPILARWLHPRQFPKSSTDAARGFYLTTKHGSFVIKQVDSTFSQVVLESTQFEYENTFIYIDDLFLNPGTSVDDKDAWHLVRLDSVRQWRHSLFSLYWMWQPSSGKFVPLRQSEETKEGKESLEKLSFAEFDPSGKFVTYGYEHDLYIIDLATQHTTRLTDSGSHNVFNGKPDWVYEEEVTSSDKLLWWSPDLNFLIYASLNDTSVSEYILDYHTDSSDVVMSYDDKPRPLLSGIEQYPDYQYLKYPKPGTNNPEVTLYCFDVSKNETVEIELASDTVVGRDFILYDAIWIDEVHFLMKVSDRTSSVQQKKVFTPHDSLKLVSTVNASDYNGWFEKSLPIATIPKKEQNTKYVDRVVVDGVVQLALFEDSLSSNYSILLGPVTLESLLTYDSIENAVYGVFGTNLNLSFGMIDLETASLSPLTHSGHYKVAFSPDGQFANLRYMGPNEPWQKLINLGLLQEHGLRIEDVATADDVGHLSATLETTNLPTHIRSTISIGSGGSAVNLNIVEIFPPNFDRTKKYPLLVHAYGGPGSVKIDDSFDIDFQDVVSDMLNSVVLIIDPRGTGKDDWTIKSFARENIGYWEPRDITAVTKNYIKTTGFINEEKVAIWGWSYGGFTTLKTLEYDKGNTFKYGMAVAPVTNWLFYDSIYTERYMNSPQHNPNYHTARINDFESFALVKRFLLIHGTADDNVHVQNSLWFTDHLNSEDVHNYDMHLFPDSDHSIYHHNAGKLVFERLLWWLEKAFMGAYD